MLKKILLVLSFYLLIFNVISCNNIFTVKPSDINTTNYNPNIDDYSISYLIDANTKNTSHNQKAENLLYVAKDEVIDLTVGISSDKKSDKTILMKVYYDYKPISFKLKDINKEYVQEYVFELTNNTKKNISLLLNDTQISTDKKIHKLLITFTTGTDQNANEFEVSTDEYGINAIYDIVHHSDYSNEVQKNASNYLIPEKNIDVNYGNLIIDVKNINNESDGIPNPPTAIKAKKDEDITLVYNLGKSNKSEALLLATLNYNHIEINNNPIQLIKLDGKDGTATGEIKIKTPKIPGNYEFITYVILDPFDKLISGGNLIYTCYRFTIIVE